MSINAPQLKVKYLSMTNIDGVIYAKFDVIKPKKLLLDDVVVDLTKLGIYSKSLENGMFVGVEQKRKDSLFTAKNTTRTWTEGHVGYFSLGDTLMFDDDKPIREVLGVDGDFDGEWDEEDILDGLSEKEIQLRIDEYKNDPWVKGYAIMPKLFLEDATRENFEIKEFLDNFIKKCVEHNVAKEVYSHYIKVDIKAHCGPSRRLLEYWDNDSILAEQGCLPKEGTNFTKLRALDYPEYTVGVQTDKEIDKIWEGWYKHESERLERKKKMLLDWKNKSEVTELT